MIDFPILSVSIALPAVTAIFMMFFMDQQRKLSIQYTAILSAFFSIMLSLKLAFDYDISVANLQFVERYQWYEILGLEYHLGVDGISIMFILLNSILTLICLLLGFGIKEKTKEYFVCFLLMQSFVIGFFSSVNLLLFFVFFEVILVPMYLIIGIWGGENRIYASIKFFLYTMLGSISFLVAIIYIYQTFGTLNLQLLKKILPYLDFSIAKYLWLAFFVAFAVKVPMLPLHTWLPDAHVQAPTGGSIILAGILLKLGGYGMFRVILELLPGISMVFADYVIWLSVAAIIYGSFVAMSQTDIKKMIAYSSVAHMGFVTAALFSLTEIGIKGAVFQMISHGVISSALFYVVGMIYYRLHTKEINRYGGIAKKMPVLASFSMLFMLASVGVPGTSGFIGEFFSLIAIYENFKLAAIVSSLGIVLGAVYMLRLYRDVMFGEIINLKIHKIQDVKYVEIFSLSIFAVLILLLGVYPNICLQYINLF